MDPFLLSLAWAIATGVSTVAGKLLDKGVIDPALEPVTEQLKQRVQAGIQGQQKNDALARALLAAIEDTSKQKGESLAVQYARRIRLHEIIEPRNAAIRDEAMRLVYLASSEDPNLVPDSLLNSLQLAPDQRGALARFLFHLRRRLRDLPDFRPLLQAAHEQAVEAALKELAGTVEQTPEGAVQRVRVVSPAWNAEPYLRYLASVCNLLQLGYIDPQYASPTSERTITLSDVYTNLEVTATVKNEEEERGKKRKPREPDERVLIAERGETRRLTALEAVSDSNASRLVLLGDPGSGKSTFVNYLAYCLALNRLEPDRKWLERLPEWTMGELLPVRVILRDWVAWVANDNARQPNAQALWDFIKHDLASRGLDKSFEPLQETLLQRGGLVLLDGLDEVPDAHARRETIKAAIEDFARACGRCRIVVTCRPYAYEKREWKLQGFAEQTLASFDSKQIEQFVHGWYNAVVQVTGMNPTLAQSKATALIAACQMPYLIELAQRPLLLTLMATLHTSRGKLPDDRADLYEDCVKLLLDYWQQGKRIQVAGQAESEKGILDALGVSRDRLDQALNQVAFVAHERQGRQANRKADTADISGEELRKVLAPTLDNSLDNAQTAIHYIRTRAGLLLERDPDTFAFPHRTFQEFLAARHLLNSEDFPFNLAGWARQDPAWWREVYLLAAGHARPRTFGQAVALINELCNKEYRPGEPVNAADANAAALAAQAAVEVRLHERATSPGRYQDTLRKLQDWLVGIIADGALPVTDWAEAGRTLSALGDPRADVSCPIPALVPVPESDFVMGTNEQEFREVVKRYGKDWEQWAKDEMPQHRVSLSPYRIGKYPVTNAQYRRFVDDGAYTEKWRVCWTDAGWQWRDKNAVEKPSYLDDPQWNLDNHPVVGVSWYEAVAYCNWLTQTDPHKRKFRLPTEAEWEKSARGTDAREYPWGKDFDPRRANTVENRIQRTTAVGLFALGESPYHAQDMAGNVWEWCSSVGYYKYKKQGPEEDGSESLEGEERRSLRGGSWFDDRDLARCADRNWSDPVSRYYSIGFRVAES